MPRMVTILSLAAALASAASLAGADETSSSTLEPAFGNTIVSTYPDGRKAELYLDRGGTYTAKGRRGDASSGRWTVKDSKICLKQQQPFGAPFSFCTPLPSGPTWTAKAVTGETIQVTIVSGRA
jgi:hypothetical protein